MMTMQELNTFINEGLRLYQGGPIIVQLNTPGPEAIDGTFNSVGITTDGVPVMLHINHDDVGVVSIPWPNVHSYRCVPPVGV